MILRDSCDAGVALIEEQLHRFARDVAPAFRR
jgi:hypothetical protein